MNESPLEAASTLAHLLRRRASERPDQLAFVFHTDDGAEHATTFAQLDLQSRRVAARVAQFAQPGDRAVLAYPPGLEFISGFFGCLYAGVTPVPATYPRPKRPSDRLDAIVADSRPAVGLTSSSTLTTLPLDKQSEAVQRLPWIPTDDLIEDLDPIDEPLADDVDAMALLQYTSGSTSDPRGVMVTHRNMMANLQRIAEGFAIPPLAEQSDVPVGVFWLPAYHDMGLIGGILTPVYVGGLSHLFAPASFLRRPLQWLELVSRQRASISGAPNFGYQLCVEKFSGDGAELDLSAWRLAFCGAEPIDPEVLERFADVFAASGFRSDAFYPCYGLAESTLLATGAQGPGKLRVYDVSRPALEQGRIELSASCDSQNAATGCRLVGCGGRLPGHDLFIVDPQTRAELPPGSVGEIWLGGPSIAQGYFHADAPTQETFGATLSDGRGPFLATGDLGTLIDGDLVVTGRLKDVIIIRGRNLYPQDVERTAQQSHEAIDLGAAFHITSGGERASGGERLVVVHQVRREHRRADLDAVCRAVRAAIVDEHEIDPSEIILLKPGSLPLTSSGKVQRGRCREGYLADALDVVHRWERRAGSETEAEPTTVSFQLTEGQSIDELSDDVSRWMLDWLADRLGAPRSELQAEAPFAELGIDSLTAIELIQGVETTLGVQISPAAAWDYPTPESLSRHLAEQMQASESPA
ncbi:MAG: AMP-binding protein [Planctomycetales bacterium]|nr:AMP-binding protein [Planctomycetales bacterium]